MSETYRSAGYLRSAFSARMLAEPAASRPEGAKSLPASAGIADALVALAAGEPVFVDLGDGWGEIRRSAIDRIVVRCWLFGIISLVEMRLRDELARMGAGRWKALLSPGRVDKAKAMKEERARRGQDTETVHNLQFGDLGTIAVRDDELFRALKFGSKRRASEFIGDLEQLRNALAHSQKIDDTFWPVIVRLAEKFERVLRAVGEGAEIRIQESEVGIQKTAVVRSEQDDTK